MVDPPPSPSKQQLQADSGKLLSSSSSSGQYLDAATGPKGSDPDGTYKSKNDSSSSSEDGSSTHGEEIQPTNEEYYEDETSSDDERVEGFSTDDDDGEYYDEFDVADSQKKFQRPSVQRLSDTQDVGTALTPTVGLFKSMGMRTSFRSFRMSNKNFEELPADTLHSIDEEKAAKVPKGPQHSAFPSSTLLIVLAMFIVVVVGVIVGCLVYYVWEREVLDPIAPPDVEIPSITTITIDPDSSNPLVPSDESLLELFATVAGNATLVEDPESAYALAADWMLYEDPGKEDLTLLPRSDRAWLQRYILVYTYFATTSDGETTWLSCNPDEDGLEESACMFSSARELPNGELVYDPVPSFRWLSGADECLWGGVACGTTIQEGITIDNGPNRPPTVTQYLRSAVTSIGLAGQKLEGSIVTDLLKLPYLDSLDLSHNSLEGSISEDFKTLKTLKLSHNEVSGSIPEGLFYEDSPLEELDIASNELTGTIPGTIGEANNLKIVKLSDNELGGTIPPLGNMPLETFHGDGNTLTGFLPFDYGYGGVWTSTLKEYWAYDNALTGTIPENIGFISELEDLRLQKKSFDRKYSGIDRTTGRVVPIHSLFQPPGGNHPGKHGRTLQSERREGSVQWPDR